MAGGAAFFLVVVLIALIAAAVVYVAGLGSWIGSRRERRGRSGKEGMQRGGRRRRPRHAVVRDDGSETAEPAGRLR